MAEKEKQISLNEIQEKTKKYLIGTYNKYAVAFSYGSGEMLYDTDGKEYIDFMCGISVTNLGHGEADIVEALRDQADRIIHSSNLFYSEEAANLAETLIVNSFPGKVFFCNSGTEANEAAFKLSRKYAIQKKIQNPLIVSLRGSFHGRTAGSMSMTGQEKIREGFGDLLDGFLYIEPNNEDVLIETFNKYKDRICAFIFEPIIGEGGILPLQKSYIQLARKLTKEAGCILILDEIQTGMGRTGKLFCYENFDIIPDAITLAKALGSGFPIGALIVGEKYDSVLGVGSHGSTFGGNHLAMRIAYETLKVILSREVLTNVKVISEFVFSRLLEMKSKYSIIKEVRGIGLHIGVDLTIPSRKIAEECLRNGLVVNSTAETVIRIMPPLNISYEKTEKGLKIFEEVILKFI
ncbi:MAG: aspartate aminotransferase family protein [Leptospiraceae bacterium]|nr:aspartate aminotransferase family protein [Leptospiraceae bacterium]MCK6379959.1 aspartate aminotransferase family protein [Leptospiraceae bacterium]NUM40081.1 aspartate aminotransferase family protein [Leptospiraceae bacterium]